MATTRLLPISRFLIEQVAAQIEELFSPRKVILFGSYGYGHPNADSDVDLMVIMETPLRSVEQSVEIRRKVEVPFPADILVRTPVEVAERLAQGDSFLREVLTKGEVLYEAPDEGVD